MILIFSTFFEPSTHQIISWLNYYKADWIRINKIDLGNSEHISSNISTTADKILFKKNGKTINFSDINSIWYRRTPEKSEVFLNIEKDLADSIKNTMNVETMSIYTSLISFLSDKKWLGDPFLSNLNKVHQLRVAAKHGIDIPDTFITSNKKDLLEFKNRHHELIIKPIHNITFHEVNKKQFAPFTQILSDEVCQEFPDNFHPCLVQECIEKEFEIRAFYLNGEFYSMAIFSQADQQTAVDFRVYNDSRPTRRVPFKLPSAIEKKYDKLMKTLGINTGSIDIIYSKNERYIFLEVNTIGQFGMVSYPCNYFLEKKIAKHLINNDTNG